MCQLHYGDRHDADAHQAAVRFQSRTMDRRVRSSSSTIRPSTYGHPRLDPGGDLRDMRKPSVRTSIPVPGQRAALPRLAPCGTTTSVGAGTAKIAKALRASAKTGELWRGAVSDLAEADHVPLPEPCIDTSCRLLRRIPARRFTTSSRTIEVPFPRAIAPGPMRMPGLVRRAGEGSALPLRCCPIAAWSRPHCRRPAAARPGWTPLRSRAGVAGQDALQRGWFGGRPCRGRDTATAAADPAGAGRGGSRHPGGRGAGHARGQAPGPGRPARSWPRGSRHRRLDVNRFVRTRRRYIEDTAPDPRSHQPVISNERARYA